MDYLNTLSPEDRKWYEQFMSEYANATICKRKDPMISEYALVNKITYNRAKKEMIGGGYTPIKGEGKPVKGSVHTKEEHVKEIFDNNNKRNNDLFGVTKVNNLLEYDVNGLAMKKDVWHETNPDTTEDTLNKIIDYKNKIKRINS